MLERSRGRGFFVGFSRVSREYLIFTSPDLSSADFF
jgi:hypothetical protein